MSFPQRERAGDRRPAPGAGGDGQRAADRSDAVAHVGHADSSQADARVEAGSVIGDFEGKVTTVVSAYADNRRSAIAGVLRGVLERFQATEVDSRLDVGRIATEPLCLDACRNRRSEGRRRKRVKASPRSCSSGG